MNKNGGRIANDIRIKKNMKEYFGIKSICRPEHREKVVIERLG